MDFVPFPVTPIIAAGAMDRYLTLGSTYTFWRTRRQQPTPAQSTKKSESSRHTWQGHRDCCQCVVCRPKLAQSTGTVTSSQSESLQGSKAAASLDPNCWGPGLWQELHRLSSSTWSTREDQETSFSSEETTLPIRPSSERVVALRDNQSRSESDTPEDHKSKEHEECCICLEPRETVGSLSIPIGPCGHVGFCFSCIQRWQHHSCPLCRGPIDWNGICSITMTDKTNA